MKKKLIPVKLKAPERQRAPEKSFLGNAYPLMIVQTEIIIDDLRNLA